MGVWLKMFYPFTHVYPCLLWFSYLLNLYIIGPILWGWILLKSCRYFSWDRSYNDRKHIFGHVCLTKIQINLCIHTVWSGYSLGAFCVAKDAKFLHVGNEDSDQTKHICRLIWDFAGHSCHKGMWNFRIIPDFRIENFHVSWNFIFSLVHKTILLCQKYLFWLIYAWNNFKKLIMKPIIICIAPDKREYPYNNFIISQ